MNKVILLFLQIIGITSGSGLLIYFVIFAFNYARSEFFRIKTQIKLGKSALEFAHDVRAPIAAISNTLSYLEISEESRWLIQRSIERIQVLSGNLLHETKTRKRSDRNDDNVKKNSIKTIVDLIVFEKKSIYRQRHGLLFEINYDKGVDDYNIFHGEYELTRILSILIDNAAEAIEHSGSISLQVKKSRRDVIITISDSGKGMPASILNKLGTYGWTHNKKEGFGLGLYYVKSTLKKWESSIHFESSLGKGTSATLVLKSNWPVQPRISEGRYLGRFMLRRKKVAPLHQKLKTSDSHFLNLVFHVRKKFVQGTK